MEDFEKKIKKIVEIEFASMILEIEHSYDTKVVGKVLMDTIAYQVKKAYLLGYQHAELENPKWINVEKDTPELIEGEHYSEWISFVDKKDTFHFGRFCFEPAEGIEDCGFYFHCVLFDKIIEVEDVVKWIPAPTF